jgi:CheY-like chemotaxis protein
MNKTLQILLAEDDENLGQLLSTFLRSKGFNTELARNGKAAFELFSNRPFNFCIFDVMMPEMDGFTLAKEIREIEAKKDFANPRYMELLMPNFYGEHICRIPLQKNKTKMFKLIKTDSNG